MNPFGVSTPFQLTPEFLAAFEAFNEGTEKAVEHNATQPTRELIREARWGDKAVDE